MTFYGNLDYLANEIRNNERRELTLELALKCKNEIEKISFYENNCFTGDFGDGEDDTWRANLYEFFDENEINDEDGSWEDWFDNEHHPSTSLRNKINSSLKESDPEIFKAYEEGQKWSQSMMVEFKNEYPNAPELIKNYKLFQFSSWFEEPDNFYKLMIQSYDLIKNRVEEELKDVDPEYKLKLEKILELKKQKKDNELMKKMGYVENDNEACKKLGDILKVI